MRIRLPNKIKIGVYQYFIKYIPHLHRDFNVYGRVCTNAGLIELDLDMPDIIKYVSLLHELIHAISDCYSLRLSDDDTDRLAQGLAQVFFNNWGIEFDWSDIKDKE